MKGSPEGRDATPVPMCAVRVLGPPTPELVRLLWGMGLRPVSGETVGTLWVPPIFGEGR